MLYDGQVGKLFTKIIMFNICSDPVLWYPGN